MSLPGNFPKEVVFYYGSQSGTAEKYCNILDEELTKLGVESTKVIDFEDFNPDVITKHELMIICAATHYEGDPCDNTKKFYKWLKECMKTPENKIFANVKFILLGLGDTSYEQFNAIGKFFNDALV